MQLKSLLPDVVDFLFPTRCAVCESAAGNSFVCADCRQQLDTLCAGAACPACGLPLSEERAPCPYCAGKGIAHYQHIVRLALFRDPLKHLIHVFKYRQGWTLGEHLADELWKQQRTRDLLASADVLVPVPLHRFRQIARGYNQADVIAARIGRLANKPLARPAKRVRHTETQTHLHSREKREANLRDAFALAHPHTVRGKSVVVIDDVMTTGATLRAFARTLKPAEPASLSALVVAVADPRHRDFTAV